MNASAPEAGAEPLETWVTALAARSREADGAPPFSDQAFVDYRLGERELVTIGRQAAALVTKVSAEFVVDPDSRGRGIGTELLQTLLTGLGLTSFWAHGDHPAARALAAKFQLEAIRELLRLSGVVSTSVDADGRVVPRSAAGRDHTNELDTFVVGRDEDQWIALNALTFVDHPEQGQVTRTDLEQLETEAWFSAQNFITLRRDGRMIGYCWLKVEEDRGEFYVVGVSPDHQGEHLGALLFDAGLARLAELGIRRAQLYVEADNEPALRLYRARGFTQDAIDVVYSVRNPTAP